jgi:endoglucanase
MATLFVLGMLLSGVAEDANIHSAAKKLGRGINIGNALEAPNEGVWGVTLKAEYFRLIHEAGFDTVRLPVKWSAHARTEPPFAIDRQFFNRIDWAIDQCLANHLNVIVNVHHYDELDAVPDANLARMTALWEQIAGHEKDRPGSVYFELYNEPHDNFTEQKWNAAVPVLLAAVRKSNPTRPVIVGPGQWNGIGALNRLVLPEADRNLILTFHYYDPFQFTHQGARWVRGADRWKGRRWTETAAEAQAVRSQFEKVATWSKRHDRPVFLGEFGSFAAADMESRVRWTHFVVREAERLGFSWAYWEFCAGFGIYDPNANTWREPLKAALVPQRRQP